MTRNLFLAFAILVTGGSWASAQSASSELYGEGVHRYFSHDYAGADQLLTEAIAGGSQDPRAYYFRGLTKEMLGGGGEADFEEGAKLEAAGRSGPMISYSLARVQGQVRAKIEKARRVARIQAAQQRALQQQAAPPVALPQVQGATDPFAGEGTRSGETPAAPVKPETNDANTDPFGDEKKSDDKKMDADPFGGDAKPAADASDPFATPPTTTEPAGDDPFK